ncbi:MAG TPA: transketolase C-terminal domain-containing protein, partial [Xanthomonadales bacterium]|nr:transketolase C-terminal domain-containing protein [Xanthomonadales bacterium]
QLRGEAGSMQFFSTGQYANPMVVRIAGLAYQKGFGGHFHNDNGIAAVREVPGLLLAVPARPDDAVRMLRTLVGAAKATGRVGVFLEPIALYMTKDLYEPGDGQWLTSYPAPDQAIRVGEGRVYHEDASDLVVFTYANGVPMSLRAAREIEKRLGWKVRVFDLRWLQPLNADAIVAQARACKRILVVDEGRRSAGVGEGVITALVEGGQGGKPIVRVVGEDTYTPLAGAANLILPQDQDIVDAAVRMST